MTAALAKCPVTNAFDPLSAPYLADPYPIYANLRSEAPVSYSPEHDFYLVTRFDDIERVLNDRDTYASSSTQAHFTPIDPEAAAILASGFPRKGPFTSADPPHHPKMRNATARCLRPRRWASIEPKLQSYVTSLCDVHLSGSRIDLANDIVLPMTLHAGFVLLGFPPEDKEQVRKWCSKRVQLMYGPLSKEDQIIGARNIVDFWEYCRKFVQRRIAQPGDDLTTDLLELSKQRGDDLTVEDVDNIVYSMALASHETTANAVLNSIIRLMRNRKHWDRLCKEPQSIPNAVEELLRSDPPIIAHRRRTTRDTELGGVEIPKGAMVIMLFGAGNHDPARFSDPDNIDLDRPNAKNHLTFGHAWHFCLGAPLARFEFNLILGELTRRAPQMRLVEDEQVKYLPIFNVRAPEAVMLEL
jgi:cytochrome P450